MKRQSTFALGLLMASFALGSQAQPSSPWVGSPLAEGEFYLYNVESGLWLQNNDSKSEDWSTRAAIGTRGFEWKIVASDGAYALQPNFYVNNTSNLAFSINPDNNYIDTGDGKAWDIKPYDAMIEAGVSNAYAINCGNKVLGTVRYNEGSRQDNLFTQQGDERWYLENPDYNIDMTERNTWQLVTKQERLAKMMAEASPTNPVDASWLIPAADLANNDKRYELWTRGWNGGNNVKGGDGGVHGSCCQESWNSNYIDFSITLTDLPNGTYRFNLQGFYRDGGRSDVLARRNNGTETIRSYYYANEVEHPLMSILDGAMTAEGTSGYAYSEGGYWYPDSHGDANRCFNLHKGYVNEEIEVVVTAHTLKIGIKKSEKTANDWTVVDNFHLTYLGNNIDLSTFVEALTNAISEAEQFDLTTTSVVLANQLQTAIEEAKAKVNSTDPDELSNATAAVLAALNAAKAVNIVVLKQTLAVTEDGVDVTAATSALQLATTADEVNKALFDLRTARKLNAMRLPDVYTGSAPEDGGEYFFYNIGTGLFLNNGSDWNTHTAVDVYALPITLVADGENFKLKNHAFYRDEQWINFNAYVDTGNQDRWFFLPVEGKDNVYNIVVFDRHDLALGYNPYGHTDRGMDYHYPLNVAKEQTDLQDPNNQWKLVSRAELDALYENATTEQPADVSYLIANPGLSRVWDINKWTLERDGGDAHHVSIDDDGNFDRNSDYGFEVWNANSFSFSQQLSGLKPGFYEVSVSGFFRQGSGDFQAAVANAGEPLISEAYLEANGEQALLPNVATEAGKLPGIFTQPSDNGTFANWPREALNAFQTGLYRTAKVVCSVQDDGELNIAVKQDQKTTDASWALFDTFRLAYLGTDLSTAINDLEPSTDNGQGTMDNGQRVYNLNGQRMTKAQKGINIINGRKTILVK